MHYTTEHRAAVTIVVGPNTHHETADTTARLAPPQDNHREMALRLIAFSLVFGSSGSLSRRSNRGDAPTLADAR